MGVEAMAMGVEVIRAMVLAVVEVDLAVLMVSKYKLLGSTRCAGTSKVC